MPNRILRDWTDSEIVDKLSAKAEVFFTRLIMQADDFGYYHANVKLLKSNLYPLRDNMRPSDITPLLAECAEVGLLGTYTTAGKEYLLIKNFGQRLRTMKSKFPPPETQWLQAFSKNDSDLRTKDSSCRLETESETESETETEGQKIAKLYPPELIGKFNLFKRWIDDNAPRVNQMKNKIGIEHFEKLKKRDPEMKIVAKTLKAMHNYKPLTSKNIDAYMTLTNWMQRDGN